MTTYSDMELFSRDLFLGYLFRNDFPLPDEEKNTLKIPHFVETVCETLDYFCDAFCSDFHSLFEKEACPIITTEEELLNYVMPRCLRLCEKPTYFNFMLACAFIAEFVNYMGQKKKCYRFRGTAYKCLIAFFNRGFCDRFEALGGWDGLRLFCEGHIAVINSIEHEHLDDILTESLPLSHQEVSNLIKNCDNVENEAVSLTCEEMSMISCDKSSIVESTFDCSNFTADADPFEFEWNLQIGPYQLTLVTKVNFETQWIYSTTVKCVTTKEPECLQEIAEDETQADAEEKVDTDGEVDGFSECSSSSGEPVGLSYLLATSDFNNLEGMVLEGSDSVSPPSLQSVIFELASAAAPSFAPEKFYSNLLARTCRWCGKKCYHYATSIFRKQRDLCAIRIDPEEEI